MDIFLMHGHVTRDKGLGLQRTTRYVRPFRFQVFGFTLLVPNDRPPLVICHNFGHSPVPHSSVTRRTSLMSLRPNTRLSLRQNNVYPYLSSVPILMTQNTANASGECACCSRGLRN